VVCTKHLLRLELATTSRPRHQRGERQRLRGLETHLCPHTGRLKATGSGRTPVPVSTQLGGGAAHSSSSQRRAIRVSSEHGSPINAQDSGTFAPRCSPRSGPHVEPEHPLGLGPMLGPVRRPALPCSSSAFSRPGSPSSLLLHALRGVGGALGGPAGASVDTPARLAPRDFGRVKIAAPLEIVACGPRARCVMTVLGGDAVDLRARGPAAACRHAEKLGCLEGLPPAEHVVHRARELVGQPRS
jgi:hypothetical protein